MAAASLDDLCAEGHHRDRSCPQASTRNGKLLLKRFWREQKERTGSVSASSSFHFVVMFSVCNAAQATHVNTTVCCVSEDFVVV